MYRYQHQQSEPRRGFTLVELIVVMGLIAFLSSIAVMAVSSFVTNAREAATRTTLLKIDRLVETRLEALDRFFELGDRRSGYFQPPEYIVQNSDDWDRFQGRGTYAGSPDTNYAVYLARKRFMRANFPQRFSDWDFNYPLDGADPPFNVVPTTHVPETESAEMLYHFLHSGATFGAPPIGEGEFLSSEVADTDGDGFPEFIDAWGNPIRFYLWPTRLIRPVLTSPSDPQIAVAPPMNFFVDPATNPDDPEHNFILFLKNNIPERYGVDTNNDGNPDYFTSNLAVDPDDILGINAEPVGNPMPPPIRPTAAAFEAQFHTMNTWHRPLIMSAGEDGRLGIFEPNDTANNGHLAQPEDYSANSGAYADVQDNLTNWYLRPGRR